jgi:molybdate transport system regulatory protein
MPAPFDAASDAAWGTIAAMIQTPRLDIRLRIDFGAAGSIGPGKIVLLEQIARTGSLSQAARDLGMSYRRAWQLLDDLNHSFDEPAATASIGGAGGGGVELTAFGAALITAYRDVERASLEATRARFAGLLKEAMPAKSLKSKLRGLLSRRTSKRRKLPPTRTRSAH